MSHPDPCRVCDGIKNNPEISNRLLAENLGVDEKTIRRHKRNIDTFFGIPNTAITSRGKSVRLADGSWEKITYDPVRATKFPAWEVIDRPPLTPVSTRVNAVPLVRKWRTAVAGADSQIGFRELEDGTLDPFHDDAALALFNKIVEAENPDRTLLCGDLIDLPSQGKYAQEAGFARTTQPAIDRTYLWLADLRSKTSGAIDFIEGNHDKRFQNFVQTNALSAFGLRRAGWPDTWPVMSIPYLLRLDELDVTYHDAYPNAHVWVNDVLRAEHGTKVNSNGSTAQKYLNETPHVSRLFGHTHRQEVVQRTTWDRAGKIRTQAINPGCLCRVDGAVPGVHSSIGPSGKPGSVVEDWQQGAAIIRYTDTAFFVELVQFDDGMTVYGGHELKAF